MSERTSSNKPNFFLSISSEIESNNEIYSYNQLEAFNSLSKNDKLGVNIVDDQPQQQQSQLPQPPTEQIVQQKQQLPLPLITNIADEQKIQLKPVDKIEPIETASIPPILAQIIIAAPVSIQPAAPPAVKQHEISAIKRLAPLKKLNERNSKPISVTASVFKTISPDVKLLKTIPPARANQQLQPPSSPPKKSIQTIGADKIGKSQLKALALIRQQQLQQQQRASGGAATGNQSAGSDPSFGIDLKANCKQKVVTASLIHSRKDSPRAVPIANKPTTSTVQNMNKTLFMFADNSPQLCCEYFTNQTNH